MQSLRVRIAAAYVLLIVVAMVTVGLVVLLVESDTLAGADRRQIALDVLIVTAVAAGTAAVIAIAVAGTITRPLERLRDAARAIASGRLDQRITPEGSRELRELGGAFNDMSRRLTESVRTRAEEHSRLEALVEAISDALVALDVDGIIRYQNRAAVDLFGEAIDRPFPEAVRNHILSGIVRDAAQQTGHQPPPVEIRGHWFRATISPIADGGGWATLVLLSDISEVRRAETTRRDFVANVSHELRTPLAGIKAVVETLRDGALDDRAAAAEFLGLVDAEVDRLVHLVEELLQLARIESGQELVLSTVQPREMLSAAIERFRLQAERAGVTLALDAPADLPPVQADAPRLSQAVGNLIHNALKFTPSGGRVTVTAAVRGGQLAIAVADTGTGIDPADLPRIFERFYVGDRARAGRGTGLGLAIVKHVARAHDGNVDVQSRLGRGSTFTIEIPIRQEAARESVIAAR
jgi:two-component system, OmpR family, phosphate regulon sensor histidine kinase PhoR